MEDLKPTTVLTIICMFCKTYMGTKDGDGVEGETASICPDCWNKQFPEEPYPEE